MVPASLQPQGLSCFQTQSDLCPTLDFFIHISADLMEEALPSKSVRILHFQPFCHVAFIGFTKI